jgi:hypothetical protein
MFARMLLRAPRIAPRALAFGAATTAAAVGYSAWAPTPAHAQASIPDMLASISAKVPTKRLRD